MGYRAAVETFQTCFPSFPHQRSKTMNQLKSAVCLMFLAGCTFATVPTDMNALSSNTTLSNPDHCTVFTGCNPLSQMVNTMDPKTMFAVGAVTAYGVVTIGKHALNRLKSLWNGKEPKPEVSRRLTEHSPCFRRLC